MSLFKVEIEGVTQGALLASVSGVVVTGLVITGLLVQCGCGGLVLDRSDEFTATEASIEPSVVTEAGYQHELGAWQNNTYTNEIAGLEYEVVTNNHVNVYLQSDEPSDEDSVEGGVGLISTPQITFAGQQLNPVDHWSPARIIQDFQDDSHPHGTLTDFQSIDSHSVTVLGSDRTVDEFTATGIQDGEQTEVVVFVLRIESRGDLIFAFGVIDLDHPNEEEQIDRLFAGIQHEPVETAPT